MLFAPQQYIAVRDAFRLYDPERQSVRLILDLLAVKHLLPALDHLPEYKRIQLKDGAVDEFLEHYRGDVPPVGHLTQAFRQAAQFAISIQEDEVSQGEPVSVLVSLLPIDTIE